MQVGELIDRLNPFRGRSETVRMARWAVTTGGKDYYALRNIRDVYWDEENECVVIEAELSHAGRIVR